MTADIAVPLWRDGKKETSPVKSPSGDHGVKKEGGEGQVVTALVQILGSVDPEATFLGAIYNGGAIPDEVCLELAEYLGKLVKATNFDNRIEIVLALHESGAISEQTQQYLLLAILEMDEDEQEKTEVEVSDGLIEIAVIPLPVVTEQALEVPSSPTPKASENTLIADLIRSAAELQRQFGTNLPDDEQSKIRQAVGKLTDDEFGSLRQILGSAILAQAELPVDRRWAGVVASLEIVEILLGQRQAELTSATFTIYEALVREGFRLRDRNNYNRPLMTVASITLLRNCFQRWLNSRESNLGEGLVSAEKAITTLEGLVLAAKGNEDTKEAIRHDQTKRLRKRIVSSRIHALDLVGEELVAAQPATKEEALQQVWGYLRAKRSELAFELRVIGSAILGEAEATIQQILNLYLATSALWQEIAELEAGNYDPLAQRPMLSDRDKRLVVYELERKELDSIRLELETVLDEGSVTDRSRNRKKFQILLVITASKIQELDQLIACLQPASALDSLKLALSVTEQEVRHG